VNYLFHSQLPKSQGQPGAGATPPFRVAADAGRSRPRYSAGTYQYPQPIRLVSVTDTQWNIAGSLKVRRSVKPKQTDKEEIRIEQTEN